MLTRTTQPPPMSKLRMLNVRDAGKAVGSGRRTAFAESPSTGCCEVSRSQRAFAMLLTALTKSFAIVACVVGGNGIASEVASAGLIHDFANDALHVQYGASKFAGIAVWYKGRLNNGQPYIANGTLFDATTIIGCAHRTPSATSTATA